jgi:hypothetical protein
MTLTVTLRRDIDSWLLADARPTMSLGQVSAASMVLLGRFRRRDLSGANSDVRADRRPAANLNVLTRRWRSPDLPASPGVSAPVMGH